MGLSNLIKQLKRRLKSRNRGLTLGVVLVLMGIASLGFWVITSGESLSASANLSTNSVEKISPEMKLQQEMLKQIQSSGKAREVFAQKNYVCGQETAKLGKLSPDQIVQYHTLHPLGRITIDTQDQVFFSEHVEDLSTQCKQNAFFGIDKKGNLSLFEGLPSQEQIIRTFFQLNIEHLKTSVPLGTMNQLIQGIKITDLAEYNSVLSTFSDYAMETNGPLQ